MLWCAIFISLIASALANSVEKRFGVAPEIEDECNRFLGNATYVASANCQMYYHCNNGWPILKVCPGNTIWSQTSKHEGRCENPADARNDVCGHVPPIPTDEELGIVDPAYSKCEFYCTNAFDECISWDAVCDGIVHCSDGSDEVDCAAPCNPQVCREPDCFCSGTSIPGGLLRDETPQMVTMTWESNNRVEDIQHILMNILKRIDASRRRTARVNPNGCPIGMTFFTEHQFNDYALTQFLYKGGHEIAGLSISKTLPYADYWADAPTALWADEYAGQRQILARLANIDPSDVRGMRAPGLQMGGNNQMAMMANHGFLYDNSMSTNQNNPPVWPSTLDYRTTLECTTPPCPTASFPGMFEVPMVNWIDTNDTLCNNVDGCYFPESKEEALMLLRSNFLSHYTTTRAPLGVHLRASWFYRARYTLEALIEFIDDLLANGDVYFVTMQQMLNWMRDPVPLSGLEEAGSFDCSHLGSRPNLCQKFNLCVYYNITYPPNSVEHQGERSFQTCNDCPLVYPWVGNPLGLL